MTGHLQTIRQPKISRSQLAAEGAGFKRWMESPAGKARISEMRQQETEKKEYERWKADLLWGSIDHPRYDLIEWDSLGFLTPHFYVRGNSRCQEVESFLEEKVQSGELKRKEAEKDFIYSRGYNVTDQRGRITVYKKGRWPVAVLFYGDMTGQYGTSHGFTSSSIDIYEKELSESEFVLRPSYFEDKGLAIYRGIWDIPLKKMVPERLDL
jgi:hypothetical protein